MKIFGDGLVTDEAWSRASDMMVSLAKRFAAAEIPVTKLYKERDALLALENLVVKAGSCFRGSGSVIKSKPIFATANLIQYATGVQIWSTHGSTCIAPV